MVDIYLYIYYVVESLQASIGREYILSGSFVVQSFYAYEDTQSVFSRVRSSYAQMLNRFLALLGMLFLLKR